MFRKLLPTGVQISLIGCVVTVSADMSGDRRCLSLTPRRSLADKGGLGPVPRGLLRGAVTAAAGLRGALRHRCQLACRADSSVPRTAVNFLRRGRPPLARAPAGRPPVCPAAQTARRGRHRCGAARGLPRRRWTRAYRVSRAGVQRHRPPGESST